MSWVVRRTGWDEAYMLVDGAWGDYRDAKRFASQDAAERAFRTRYQGEGFGLFSTGRRGKRS